MSTRKLKKKSLFGKRISRLFTPLNILNRKSKCHLTRNLRATLSTNELKYNPPTEGCPRSNLHRRKYNKKHHGGTKRKSIKNNTRKNIFLSGGSKTPQKTIAKYVNKWWNKTKHKKIASSTVDSNEFAISRAEEEELNKQIQDEFMNSTFEKIRGKTFAEVTQMLPQLCIDYNETIVKSKKNYFTVNICSYIVTYIILESIEFHRFRPNAKIKQLYDLHNNVYLGRDLKQYGLTSLTSFPVKSLELLNSCKDDEYYCSMNPGYFINDNISYRKVYYLCESGDPTEINCVNNLLGLSRVRNGTYLYCLLPRELLCLFEKDFNHSKITHSSGACGQPVICAGNIILYNGKIKQIDNSSGHYKPPIHMLFKAIEILKKKYMIMGHGTETTSSNENIKTFNFDP